MAFVSAAAMAFSCVIADPPTELATVPVMRPTILRGSVVPSVSAVLGRWPAGDKFIVPVELVDPNMTINYAAFVDFNAALATGLDGPVQSSEFERGGTTEGRVRTLDVIITEPSLDRCHVVEVVVANTLNSFNALTAHTPAGPGGDSVLWYYSPSGDLAGCPVLDAGIAPLADAAAEADARAEVQ